MQMKRSFLKVKMLMVFPPGVIIISLLPYNFILMQYIFAVTFFLLVTLLYFKIKVMYINLIFKKFLLPLRPLSVNYFLDLAITIVISTQLVKAILENNY